uniref:Uncharacterized protein n=1 Tax=Romanomermis culicivorax TaxID=13658 RepID=A0A915KDF9_ROMCU
MDAHELLFFHYLPEACTNMIYDGKLAMTDLGSGERMNNFCGIADGKQFYRFRSPRTAFKNVVLVSWECEYSGISGTFYTGDRWCLELYAGRVYCKYACLNYLNIDAANIECQKIECGTDPNSASSITVTCNCHGTNINTRVSNGRYNDTANQSIADDYSIQSSNNQQTSDTNSRVINKNTNIKSKKVIFMFNDKAYDASSENDSSFKKKLMDMINDKLLANDTIDK